MNTYRVTLTHEDLEGPLVVDLLASSDIAAVTRVRFTAMHMYHHADLLFADCTTEILEAVE